MADVAFRLSVFPEGDDEATQPLQPLFGNSESPSGSKGEFD
jgi:hypothetical protein